MSKAIKKQKTKLPKAKLQPEAKAGDEVKRTKIRVIGIGGGGGTIISEISSKMPRASFVAANTDGQALKSVARVISRFPFGQALTRGLGTGMNPELGTTAALSDKDKIKKLLEGQDLCVLVACLGGGTGSGAVPVFAKISRSLGNITYGIFTLPFKFEGERKMEIARESLKRVKNYLNAVTIIPNERVFQIIDKNTPLRQSLSVINKNLADGLGGLIETIYEPGLINIDFADFRTILDGKGRLAYLNTVEVQKKEGSTKELITEALNSPLFPYSIKGGKGVLLNISGEKELSLSDVAQISKTISDLVNPEAKIIFGVSQSKQYSNILKTTLMVTGCNLKIFPKLGRKKRRKKPKKEEMKEPVGKKEIKPKKKRKPRKTKVAEKPKPKKRRKIRVKKEKNEVSVLPSAKEEKPEAEREATEEKVRKNALQIRKESEEVEKEMVEREKFWETPAFLRKKIVKGQ